MTTVTYPVSAAVVRVRPVSRPRLGAVYPLVGGRAVQGLHGGGVGGAVVSVLTWSGAAVHLVTSSTHGVVFIKEHVLATLHVLHTAGVKTLVILRTGVWVGQTDAGHITWTAIGELCHTLT